VNTRPTDQLSAAQFVVTLLSILILCPFGAVLLLLGLVGLTRSDHPMGLAFSAFFCMLGGSLLVLLWRSIRCVS
jgi:hypothetical protein